jgi:hypothetical protein
MAVQISSMGAQQKMFEPESARAESEILADIDGMSSKDIMKFLDEEFERHEEVCHEKSLKQ